MVSAGVSYKDVEALLRRETYSAQYRTSRSYKKLLALNPLLRSCAYQSAYPRYHLIMGWFSEKPDIEDIRY
jgi:hypothetical protein